MTEMKLLIVLGTLVLTALVSGNINGQHPAVGTCLCLTGTNVSAALHSTVLASLSQPSCYKFQGGIHENNGYKWYQLQNVHADNNAWVAGKYLRISLASNCSTSASGSDIVCKDPIAKDYACKLLHLADAGTITLWKQNPSGVHDNAYAYNNIRDACAGHAASRSHYNCSECPSPGAPGGYVCLGGTLLHYIYVVHESLGYIHVNEISGACHTCNSLHYQGKAVYLHNPSAAQYATIVSLCKSMGGNGWDEGNHVHCQF